MRASWTLPPRMLFVLMRSCQDGPVTFFFARAAGGSAIPSSFRADRGRPRRGWLLEDARVGGDGQEFVHAGPGNCPGRVALGVLLQAIPRALMEARVPSVGVDENVRVDRDHPLTRPSLVGQVADAIPFGLVQPFNEPALAVGGIPQPELRRAAMLVDDRLEPFDRQLAQRRPACVGQALGFGEKCVGQIDGGSHAHKHTS